MQVLKLSSCIPVDRLAQTLRCPAPPLGTPALFNKHLLSVSYTPVSCSQGAHR